MECHAVSRLVRGLAVLGVVALPLGTGAAVVQLTGKTDFDDFGRKPAALIMFDEAEKESDPQVLDEVAAQLGKLSPFIPVARVVASDKLGKDYDPETMSLPAVKFFSKGKETEEYDGEWEIDQIVAYAKKQQSKSAPVEIEEMKSSRADRLCFDAQGLCVIYLANGAEISQEELGMLTRLKRRHTSKLSAGANARGATLNWSWLDATVQYGFKALLNGDEPALPGVVIYNPHKRLRYMTLDEGVVATEEDINGLIDKVLGGDARFTPAKGQKRPVFAGKETAGEEL